ncbi:MAG: VOC family protein [Candidatus Nanopelagicales bacterium]
MAAVVSDGRRAQGYGGRNMASVGIYLNFRGDTEEVFEFYRDVFGGELTGLMRMRDMLESMGHVLEPGNNLTISLTPDTLEEAQRLFDALNEHGSDAVELQQMFWGAYWGTCRDRFGTRWLFSLPVSAEA